MKERDFSCCLKMFGSSVQWLFCFANIYLYTHFSSKSICETAILFQACHPPSQWPAFMYIGTKVNYILRIMGFSHQELLVNFSQSVKTLLKPWLVWLSGLSASLRTKGSPFRFSVRAHARVVSQVPSGRQPHIDVSLPLFLPPFPSLKINK